MRNSTTLLFSYLILLFILVCNSYSQESPNFKSENELYNKIKEQDSLLFDAFNKHDLTKLKNYFSEDLEFFHDKSGLTSYTQTINGFESLFKNVPDLKRNLVKGSLEVYPVKDYGAIQIGLHTFCHKENGKDDCGTFKFVHIWQFKNGEWKITRIISYDH